MMGSIAGAAMSMANARLSVDYSIAVTKKAMESQEMMAQEMLEMLSAASGKGAYIDTYA